LLPVVRTADHPVIHADRGIHRHTWRCPYHDCGAEHRLTLNGENISVVARFDPPTALGHDLA
jgi:hypothetical protein